MRLDNAPYLGSINGGAELRRAATKLQNISVVAYNAAGTDLQRDRLIAFWKDQKARVLATHGHPADGVFCGFGVYDIRKLCYKVLSAIRKFRKAEDIAAWNFFCDYFIMAADSLRETHSAVASLEITPAYFEGGEGTDHFPGRRSVFWVTMKDATGKLVPMSHDKPGLGKLVVKYDNEGTAGNMGKWREEFPRVPDTNPFLFDHGSFTSPPSTMVNGQATVHFKYVADVTPVVEASATYWRGKAPGEDQVNMTADFSLSDGKLAVALKVRANGTYLSEPLSFDVEVLDDADNAKLGGATFLDVTKDMNDSYNVLLDAVRPAGKTIAATVGVSYNGKIHNFGFKHTFPVAQEAKNGVPA